MPLNHYLLLLLAFLTSLPAPAQDAYPWSATEPTALPGPAGQTLAERRLTPPARGAARLRLRARLRGDGGKAYLYAYGSSPRNAYLGYRESPSFAVRDTVIELETFVSAEMDEVVVGVGYRGTGTLSAAPPEVEIAPARPGELPVKVRDYLGEFFGYVEDYALDRDSLDWETLRADALALSAGAATPAEVHPVLNYTLRRIDRHSFLRPPREQEGWARGNNDNDEIDPGLEYATGRRVDGRMVYLRMPGVSSGHDKTLTAYADSLQALIARLDGPEVDEWMLDLRPNTGGNCWPMLAGLGPLLGEGICGYFMRRDGSEASAWVYHNGASWLDGRVMHRVAPTYRTHRPPRVAVLYGPKTSSSGEVVAIAFRGLGNTRSFGRPTGGYSTGNQTIRLSDGAAVLLTVSVYGDRNKTPYGEAVPPEEPVEPGGKLDAVAEAAADWLRAER